MCHANGHSLQNAHIELFGYRPMIPGRTRPVLHFRNRRGVEQSGSSSGS